MLSEWGGAGWGIVGLAEGSLRGLCCEHCVDGGQWMADGYMELSGVSVGRMRKSVASVGWSWCSEMFN